MASRSRHDDLGQRWIAAWNSRDLDRILALYDDRAEMASDGIVRLGFDPSGRLAGKDRLRAYWSRALDTLPGLHFDLIDIAESPDSLVLRYRNDRGQTVSEYLRLNAAGLIVQGSANHALG